MALSATSAARRLRVKGVAALAVRPLGRTLYAEQSGGYCAQTAGYRAGWLSCCPRPKRPTERAGKGYGSCPPPGAGYWLRGGFRRLAAPGGGCPPAAL